VVICGFYKILLDSFDNFRDRLRPIRSTIARLKFYGSLFRNFDRNSLSGIIDDYVSAVKPPIITGTFDFCILNNFVI